MEKENMSYGLLIAAMVAIVAVVGLVTLFSKTNATGAASYNICPPGKVLGLVVDEQGTHQACRPNVQGERPFKVYADTDSSNIVE